MPPDREPKSAPEDRWQPILTEDFSSANALSAWTHEGHAEARLTDDGELFVEVGNERADGTACPWSTLWYNEPVWGDLRFVVKARGEEQGMRLFFFNAQGSSDTKSIFEWQRDTPNWPSYAGESRMALYTVGMLRFAGLLNLRGIGGPLADSFNAIMRAAGTPEQKDRLEAYRSQELLCSTPTPYSDPDKTYVLDVRVIGASLQVRLDGAVIMDVDDARRRDCPLQGGYFGLRNFEAGTRTWYESVSVYRLADDSEND